MLILYSLSSLKKPVNLADAEIKLESTSTNAAIFLANYTAVSVAEGFEEYTTHHIKDGHLKCFCKYDGLEADCDKSKIFAYFLSILLFRCL